LTDKPTSTGWRILTDDLSGAAVHALLEEHLDAMEDTAPPESRHELDLDGLRQPGITFWTAWDANNLAGCGAMKELDDEHGEVKSMRTSSHYHQRGVASALLEHLLSEARSRGYKRVSLETGSMAFFEPARRLYKKHGFEYCGPFGDYKDDPLSAFMAIEL
jgi:putative acetyltransferase